MPPLIFSKVLVLGLSSTATHSSSSLAIGKNRFLPRKIHQAALTGFGKIGKANSYENGRPGYGQDIIKAITSELQGSSSSTADQSWVVEVGAGTGKLSRSLAPEVEAQGMRYLATEPVAGMRQQFSELLPSILMREGTGEKIPLPSGSCKGVVAAQAFHWMATRKCTDEFHRVLSPKGMVALVWNTRDTENYDWVRQLEDEIITPCYPPDVPRQQTCHWKAAFHDAVGQERFTPLKLTTSNYFQQGDLTTIVQRVMTISCIANRSKEKQERIEARTKHLIQSHPQTAGKTELAMPYVTHLYTCNKL